MSKAFKIYIAFASAGIFLAGLAYLSIVPRFDRNEEFIAKKQGFTSFEEKKQFEETIKMLIHDGVKDSKTRKMVAHGLKSFSSSARADLLARASGFFYDLPKRNSIETQTQLLNLIKVSQNDPSARVRSRLAQTLVRFNCAEANAILFQLAENDPSDEVRATAKSTIAERNKK